MRTAERRADPGPTAERIAPRDHVLGAATAVGVAIAWSLLAWWRPTVTFHLAPVFVAAGWAVALRRGAPVRVAASDAARGAAAGGLIALVATASLYTTDLMRGPTLWGSGPVLVEVLPAVALGALAGYRYARCGAPGG